MLSTTRTAAANFYVGEEYLKRAFKASGLPYSRPKSVPDSRKAGVLACLIMFPVGNSTLEEMVQRFEECETHSHSFPKRFDSDKPRNWVLGGRLAPHFSDKAYQSEGFKGRAPLRKFDYASEQELLSLPDAVVEIMRAMRWNPVLERVPIHTSEVEYNTDANCGWIHIAESALFSPHEGIVELDEWEDVDGQPERKIEFGEASDANTRVNRSVRVSFQAIRDLGTAFMEDGLLSPRIQEF